MRTRFTHLLAASVLAAAVPAPLLAETAGETDFQTFCAMCHGDGGKGDGSMAGMLINGAPDLTQLAANNNGTFPQVYVVEIIDGRSDLRGHEGKMMPLFGQVFTDVFGEAAPYFNTAEYTRQRILGLAAYIESLQE